MACGVQEENTEGLGGKLMAGAEARPTGFSLPTGLSPGVRLHRLESLCHQRTAEGGGATFFPLTPGP